MKSLTPNGPYVALFAEAEGFEHIHFHVIPRKEDLDRAFRGPSVFTLLGGDTTTLVPEQVMDQIASKLAASVRLRALSGQWNGKANLWRPSKRAALSKATSPME